MHFMGQNLLAPGHQAKLIKHHLIEAPVKGFEDIISRYQVEITQASYFGGQTSCRVLIEYPACQSVYFIE